MMMKQMEVESQGDNAKLKRAAQPPPSPPPSPPPLPSFLSKTKLVSVTNQQIVKFWRKKRMEEEDHLLFAIKAAARIRAQNFKEKDYKCFEESSLKEDEESTECGATASTTNSGKTYESSKELHVGIKDWWTKSKYAYLNQPAMTDPPQRRTSTYIPNFCNYKPAPPPTASFGIF